MQCLHGWGQRGAMELLVREQVGGQPCSLVVLIARYKGWRLQEATLPTHHPGLFFDGCALLNLPQTGVCTGLHCFTAFLLSDTST